MPTDLPNPSSLHRYIFHLRNPLNLHKHQQIIQTKDDKGQSALQ